MSALVSMTTGVRRAVPARHKPGFRRLDAGLAQARPRTGGRSLAGAANWLPPRVGSPWLTRTALLEMRPENPLEEYLRQAQVPPGATRLDPGSH